MIRTERYGEVQAFEMAPSVAGRAIWTVRVYAVGGVLIDTGQPHMRRHVLALARRLGIEAVLLTHHHEDHAGNAAALSRELGLPVMAGPAAVPLVADTFWEAPFQLLTWGRHEPATIVPVDAPLTIGRHTFEPVPAPGHSADMTAWWVREEGWLFSGDLYLADRVRFCREDEDLAATKASLDRVSRLDFDALFCAHNPKAHGGPARLAAKLAFIEELEAEIKRRAAAGQGVDSIADELLRPDWFLRWFTSGRASTRHLVRAALAAP